LLDAGFEKRRKEGGETSITSSERALGPDATSIFVLRNDFETPPDRILFLSKLFSFRLEIVYCPAHINTLLSSVFSTAVSSILHPLLPDQKVRPTIHQTKNTQPHIMPSTRSSARIASKSSDNLAADASSSPTNDNKRKADDASPAKDSAKKSKKAAIPKKQKTIEQTMELKNEGEEGKGVKEAESDEKDVEMKEAGEEEKDGGSKEADSQSESGAIEILAQGLIMRDYRSHNRRKAREWRRGSCQG